MQGQYATLDVGESILYSVTLATPEETGLFVEKMCVVSTLVYGD